MLTDSWFFISSSGSSWLAGEDPAPGCTLTLTDLEGDIVAKVAVDGYSKGYGERGPWRKIRYFVLWSQSDRFIDLLRGGAPAVVGGVITFPTPHRYPGNTNLICVNAVGTPHGPSRPEEVKLYGASHCWVDCDYEVPRLDVYGEQFQTAFESDQPVPWASLSERSAEEMVSVSLEDTVFVYAGGGGPSGGNIGIPVAGTIIEIRRGMIPNDLYNTFMLTLRSLAGKLNNATFMGYAAGTVRLEDWSKSWQYDANGNLVWEFAINLRWREHDHNMELIEGQLDDWDYLETPSGDRRFGYADFSVLHTLGVM